MRRACVALLLAASACRGRSEAGGDRARTPDAPPQGSASEDEGSPVSGGELRRRLLGEPTTLNAVLQSSVPEAQVLQYVQRNLFDFDDKLALRPGLASG